MKKFILFLLVIFCNLSAQESKSLLVILDASPKIVQMNKDGFVAAMELLEKDYKVEYYNLNLNEPDPDFGKFDAVFIKSNWNCAPDLYARKKLPQHLPKALLISGVNPIPDDEVMHFYDVLFYETMWYKPQIEKHPCIIHAFGINTDIMNPGKKKRKRKKKYDYIMVGEFKPEKRFEKLLDKEGKKLSIGLIYNPENSIICNLLQQGVKIKDYVPYEKLAKLYRNSKCCYQPCLIDGGGERAILEARACGINVEVESDNPKLMELTNCPIWDHIYYYNQLKVGLELLLKSSRS